jgi:hypothetical protein
MAPVHIVKITRDRLDAETRRGPDCSQFHGSAGSANLVPCSTVCVSKFENAAHVRILEHYSVPHVGCVVRTRVLCLAGARGSAHARRDRCVAVRARAALGCCSRMRAAA